MTTDSAPKELKGTSMGLVFAGQSLSFLIDMSSMVGSYGLTYVLKMEIQVCHSVNIYSL